MIGADGCSWTLRTQSKRLELYCFGTFLRSLGSLFHGPSTSSAPSGEITSYHYAPASDEIAYDETLLLTIEEALNKSDIEHSNKAWTTDAFYRETADKVKRRLAAGATVVDEGLA